MVSRVNPPINPLTKFFDRALAEGCAFFGGLFALAVVACVVLSSCAAQGQSPPQGQSPTPIEAKAKQDRDKLDLEIAVARAKSNAKCDCTKDKLVTWKKAVELANRDRLVVVVYADVEPRCCGDALPVKMTVEEAKLLRPEKPIVVYIPAANGGLIQVTDLPANATSAEIKRAVELAKDRLKK